MTECVYDDVGRWYKQPNGLYYPSITTVIGWSKKDKLSGWENRIGFARAEEIRAKAAERGTLVHELAESYMETRTPPKISDRNTKISFGKIKAGIDKIIPVGSNRILSETPMVSHVLRVAGRCDVISPLITDPNGPRAIIDFKTSEKERKDEWNEDYFVQLSGYSFMHEEMTGERIDDLILIFSIDALSVPVFKYGSRSEFEPRMRALVEKFHSEVGGPKL